MQTRTAAASLADQVVDSFPEAVVRRRVLIAWGLTVRMIDAQIAAGRWRQFGQAVVLHAGAITARHRRSIALANAGSRVLLTSFSGLAEQGLTGWDRDAVHLLVPGGARITRVAWLPVVAHQVADWVAFPPPGDGRRHRTADATALAAESFEQARSGMGLLAAVVQQRLVSVDTLRAAIDERHRHRHRRLLLAALDDIAMGAQALSEIDFAVLCRSLKLPEPERQAPRADDEGRNRYLDVEWALADGRRVAAEIDGALHMQFERYTDDLFRQNDVVLDRRSIVLRFSSMAVRTRDDRLVRQLRRALR